MLCLLLLPVGPSAWSQTQDDVSLYIDSEAQSRIHSLAVDPSSDFLAAGGDQSSIYLWNPRNGALLRTLATNRDPQTGRVLRSLANPDEFITALAFSPDGRSLAAAGTDQTVRLWDYNEGQLSRTMLGHTRAVRSLAFYPQGGLLASGGDDGVVHLWDLENGQIVQSLEPGGAVQTLAFSPDGTHLVTGLSNGGVILWNTDTWQPVGTLASRADTVSALAFSADGRMLAFSGSDGRIRLWDVPRNRLLRMLTARAGVAGLAFHPDGRWLAAAGRDGMLRLWNPDTGALSHELEAHENSTAGAAFAPKGWLASGGLDGRVRLWQPAAEAMGLGAVRLVLLALPRDNWLAWNPDTLYYNASPGGEAAARLQFDREPETPYALSYYRSTLYRPDLLAQMDGTTAPPAPDLAPKSLRLQWDRLPYKPFWLSLPLLLAGLVVAVLLLRRPRPNGLTLLGRFFREVGFDRVKPVQGGFLISRQGGGLPPLHAMALECGKDCADETARLLHHHAGQLPVLRRLYLILQQDRIPASDGAALQELTRQQQLDLVLLTRSQMTEALQTDNCAPMLEQQEAAFLESRDPYQINRSLPHPLWLFGHDRLLEQLTQGLEQNRFVGVFGLPRIGKSSLVDRLSGHLVDRAVLSVPVYSLPSGADPIFAALLTRFRALLADRGVRRLPKLPLEMDITLFRQVFLALYQRWLKVGRGPVVIMLNGIDRLLPDDRVPGYQSVLAEYAQLCRALVGLNADQQRLMLVITALRPDVNRREDLGSLGGDNPLRHQLQEIVLAGLDRPDSDALLRELGHWRGIHWDDQALERAFHYCGGHPWVTLLFASQACRRGALEQVDANRVEMTAAGLSHTDDEPIDLYYQGVWRLLDPTERHLLERLSQRLSQDLSLKEGQRRTLRDLEHMGLVRDTETQPRLRAALFADWLGRQGFRRQVL